MGDSREQHKVTTTSDSTEPSIEPISQAIVEQIIEEIEGESPTRKLAGSWRLMTSVLAAG